MQPLVTVYRGEIPESRHYGSVAVVDAGGRLLAFAGDPSAAAFIRSAAKPFQAIPFLAAGGREEFDLTDEELALICASHGGEARHLAGVAALLRKGEFDESDLQCGAHAPLTERAAAELRQSGEEPSALHNNCSGKHAGMLLAALMRDEPTSSYLDPEHPLQREIHQTVARFAALEPPDIPIAVDGCGVPCYFLSLHRTALAYARLFDASRGGHDAAPAAAIVGAMTGQPDYVAGGWSITTPLMQSFDGQLLAKDGAEGFYAIALSPELCSSLPRLTGAGTSVGIAIKISDGSMGRGRNPAIVRTLECLGVDIASRPLLAAANDVRVANVAGRIVGAVRSEFDLVFI